MNTQQSERTSVKARSTNASRLFGYDIFISFALGAPPRGTHSYASDLARRLRERDFVVFFSDDQAPVHRHNQRVTVVQVRSVRRESDVQQKE